MAVKKSITLQLDEKTNITGYLQSYIKKIPLTQANINEGNDN